MPLMYEPKTISDMIERMPERAKKADGSVILNIFNTYVRADIQPTIVGSFPELTRGRFYLDGLVSISGKIILPEDFGSIIKARGGGQRVKFGSIASREKGFYVTMDEEGNNVLVLSENYPHNDIEIFYETRFPEPKQLSSPLPYPPYIAERVISALASGCAYYYFRSRKKTAEAQLEYTQYEDLKKSLFLI